jgi:hypothetical protein
MKRKMVDKIKRAERAIATADAELEEVLRAVQVAPRAEKTIVSKVLKDAFVKLKAAKSSLLELEKLLAAIQD